MTAPEAGTDDLSKIRLDLERLAASEPDELRDLPVEVRRLVHAVDSMRDHWADSSDARRDELWTEVMRANEAVWGRLDPPEEST